MKELWGHVIILSFGWNGLSHFQVLIFKKKLQGNDPCN